MNPEIFRALLLAAVMIGSLLIGTTIYQRYTGLKRWQAAVLWLLALGGGALWVATWTSSYRHDAYHPEDQYIRTALFQISFVLLTAPFIVKLYRKWIGNHLTAAEKQPGIDGVRAWLGVGNIICATLIPLCAWGAVACSPVSVLALTYGLLLAYPLLNLASESARPAPATPVEDLSSEREKVLQLLEAGKITADESSELLNALGHSAKPAARPAVGFNPQRKLVLAGAALLLAGFFIPWFSINPGAMLNDLTSRLQQSMQVTMSGTSMSQPDFPHFNLNTGTMQVHARDIQHGLGWWILLLGLAAAALPLFATTLEAGLQKKIILAALCAGAFLLIYLLSDAFRYASFGILLALAGYVLELVGTLKERVPAR